jgi:hypothetical protein
MVLPLAFTRIAGFLSIRKLIWTSPVNDLPALDRVNAFIHKLREDRPTLRRLQARTDSPTFLTLTQREKALRLAAAGLFCASSTRR